MTHIDEAELNEYLDGVLDEAAATAVAAHLAVCPACRAQLTELERVFTALAALPEAPLAADLSARVLAELEPPPLSRRAKWVLAAQGVTAVILLLLLWPTLTQLWQAVSPALSLTWTPPLLPAWTLPEITLPAIAPGLDVAQWGLLLGAAFAAWLIAGRWLLFLDTGSNGENDG